MPLAKKIATAKTARMDELETLASSVDGFFTRIAPDTAFEVFRTPDRKESDKAITETLQTSFKNFKADLLKQSYLTISHRLGLPVESVFWDDLNVTAQAKYTVELGKLLDAPKKVLTLQSEEQDEITRQFDKAVAEAPSSSFLGPLHSKPVAVIFSPDAPTLTNKKGKRKSKGQPKGQSSAKRSKSIVDDDDDEDENDNDDK